MWATHMQYLRDYHKAQGSWLIFIIYIAKSVKMAENTLCKGPPYENQKIGLECVYMIILHQ